MNEWVINKFEFSGILTEKSLISVLRDLISIDCYVDVRCGRKMLLIIVIWIFYSAIFDSTQLQHMQKNFYIIVWINVWFYLPSYAII